MRRGISIALVVLASCGARSSLDPDGEGQSSLPPPVGGMGGAGVGAAEPGGGGGAGGEGEGGREPACIPVACEATWVTALPQSNTGYFGEVTGVAGDACGFVTLVVRTEGLELPDNDLVEGSTLVLRFDHTGTLLWHQQIVPYDADALPDVALAGTAGGEVVIASAFEGQLSLGELDVSSDQKDIVLARLDTDGEVLWARAFSSSSSDYVSALAVAPDGDILLGGRSGGSSTPIDLGGGPLQKGLFLARLSPTGEHRWSYRFAEEGRGPVKLHASADGDFWVMGRSAGDHQFPGGAFSAGEGERLFVARLHADGTRVFDRVYGDGSPYPFTSTEPNAAESLALDEDHVRFTIAWKGTVDFGGGTQEMGEPGPLGLPAVAIVELDGAGAFVSSSSVLGPAAGITAVQGPSGVLLGLYDALVTVVDGVVVATEPLAAGFGEPEMSRIPDGTVLANPTALAMELAGTQVPPQSVYVGRLCDGP